METLSPPQIALKRAFEELGGVVNAASVLGVPDGRYQTLQSWVRNRVPAEYCPLIEQKTGVKCEELRPDVAWAVLRKPSRKRPSKSKEA